MKHPLRATLAAFAAAAGALLGLAGPASAAPSHAPAPAAVTVTYAGTVALDDCSGSLIAMPSSVSSDPALVMTNGHCLETGFLDPGQVVVDQSSTRSFSLLSATGRKLATLRAVKVAYATMTDTDITIYQLGRTYAQIQSSYGIAPLRLAATHPTAGAAIEVVSGYWKTTYSCSIDGFVHELHESDWVWKDSVRYTSTCNTIGGTSGSPVIDTATGLVVAVNNTGNEDGASCTLDNPCEVDQDGNVTVHQGTNYAEETYEIPACVAAGNRFDLTLPGCTLPKP